jgi:hypothetical protein
MESTGSKMKKKYNSGQKKYTRYIVFYCFGKMLTKMWIKLWIRLVFVNNSANYVDNDRDEAAYPHDNSL